MTREELRLVALVNTEKRKRAIEEKSLSKFIITEEEEEVQLGTATLPSDNELEIMRELYKEIDVLKTNLSTITSHWWYRLGVTLGIMK